MVYKGTKEICPTCGQHMNLLKSEKQQTKMEKTVKDEDSKLKAFDISQIWHCINCSEEWEIDIIKNIWRKSEITK